MSVVIHSRSTKHPEGIFRVDGAPSPVGTLSGADSMDDEDKPREECGVLGIFSPGVTASRVAFFSLYALQHRGQEGSGIASSDGRSVHVHRGSGLVSQIFTEENMKQLHGHMAVGHTRYSTTGASVLTNTQPFVIETIHGPLAMAHNGQLALGKTLRKNLMERGVGMFTSSDSEVIIQTIAQPPAAGPETNGPDWIARIKGFMAQADGSYSVVMMTRDGVYAFRDPLGMRPLCIGRFSALKESLSSSDPSNKQECWVIASESCALGTLNAEFIRDVRPGEIVKISEKGLESFEGRRPSTSPAFCVFEYVYFARPDSVIEARLVHHVRQALGRRLALDHPAVGADIVVGVPDSSTPMAIGFSQQSGIPFTEGLTKNRYIQRTFIQPEQHMRVEAVSLKYNPLRENLDGKNVVLVDDSLVRGTTVKKLIGLLRSAGAKMVHVRIASPPIKHPCYMGIDMKSHEELIAFNSTPDQVREFIGAESLAYLSHEALIETVQNEGDAARQKDVVNHFCSACFSGSYPLAVDNW